jgi:sugar/nucleoside kinase (ribokinase family)
MIAVIGQSVLDRISWPDGRIEERLGGSPVFAARALAATSPALVITQGADTVLRQPLHDCGVEVCEGPSERTTVFEVTLHGDGGWHESIVAFGDPFTRCDVETWMSPALARASAVVCGTQWRDDFPPETLALLARGGRTVYLDGQGAARPRRLGLIRLEGPLDPRAVAGVDVLKLAEEEAAALIGGIDPVAALALRVPVVVVTLGERGAVVLADGVATEVGVEPVVGLADTVGAGDSFLALMAAAVGRGAEPILAAGLACEAVARLLRARLAGEREAAVAGVGGHV